MGLSPIYIWLKSFESSLAKKGLRSNKLNIAAELGSTEAVIQGIKSNIGISILSPIAVAEELQSGTLKALMVDGLNLKRNFYISRYKNRTESPLGKMFRIFIEKNIPAHLY